MSKPPSLNSKWWPLVTGVLTCGLAALLVATLFSGHSASPEIPFAFLAVVVGVAMRFGAWVGIAGSLMTGMIFAYRLYSPLNSLQVHNQVARSNLAWMVLAGVVLSFLLAPSSHITQPRK